MSVHGKEFNSLCKAYPDFIDSVGILKTGCSVDIQSLLKNFLLRPQMDEKERKIRLYCGPKCFSLFIEEICKV